MIVEKKKTGKGIIFASILIGLLVGLLGGYIFGYYNGAMDIMETFTVFADKIEVNQVDININQTLIEDSLNQLKAELITRFSQEIEQLNSGNS